jgi:hypothetical protein
LEQLNVRVPVELIQALREKARIEDRSVTGLVRLAVRDLLDRDREKASA